MRKMLIILAVTICSYVNAQKGSILVMGNVSYNSQNDSGFRLENKQNGFGIQPKIGYQFHENWTAGIESNFINSKQSSFEGNQYRDKIYGFGGFVRYAKPLSSIFSAYADLGLGYHNRKETFTNATGQTYNDTDGFYTSITPAIFVDISKGFGLNFNIGGLNYSTSTNDSATGSGFKSKAFEFNFGKAFSVGISKNF